MEVNMFDFIERIFIFQEKTRELILKNKSNLKRILIAYLITLVFLPVYAFCLSNKIYSVCINNVIFSLIFFVNILSGFIISIKAMCTRISHSLLAGLFITVTLGIGIYYFFSKSFIFNYKSYILITVIFTVIWTFLSTFSDNKIGKLSNSILAVLVGIVLQANSFILRAFNINGVIDLKFTAVKINISTYELTELEINKLLFPFFVMAAVGALACAYKEYWLEENEKKLKKFRDVCSKLHKR